VCGFRQFPLHLLRMGAPALSFHAALAKKRPSKATAPFGVRLRSEEQLVLRSFSEGGNAACPS